MLAREIVDLGFVATVVSIDASALDPTFLGRQFDHDLLDDLPEGVDPCGERGEMHTFVTDGPCFERDIRVQPGEARLWRGFPTLGLRAG